MTYPIFVVVIKTGQTVPVLVGADVEADYGRPPPDPFTQNGVEGVYSLLLPRSSVCDVIGTYGRNRYLLQKDRNTNTDSETIIVDMDHPPPPHP